MFGVLSSHNFFTVKVPIEKRTNSTIENSSFTHYTTPTKQQINPVKVVAILLPVCCRNNGESSNI